MAACSSFVPVRGREKMSFTVERTVSPSSPNQRERSKVPHGWTPTTSPEASTMGPPLVGRSPTAWLAEEQIPFVQDDDLEAA